MAESSTNVLVSSKSSDSGLHVQLHPLVLLTISDNVTRHIARQQQGPVVGALLGQQNGREMSLEYAFECEVITASDQDVFLHQAWFEKRVKQFKDVHKAPALDLVGWFTITPPSGPNFSHLRIHRWILQEFNESAVLLAFHPSLMQSSAANGAKLPLTIYESLFEGETTGDGDKRMHIDGEDQLLNIRFREVPYSVETGEAEMISVDFVATTGGNAMAVQAPVSDSQLQPNKKDNKIISRQDRTADLKLTPTSPLSPEDEDVIASLTNRLNAIKTLESRVRLIKIYLSELPPPYLDNTVPESRHSSPPLLSYPILRQIACLISHLYLLNPQDRQSFAVESLAQANDVSLVSLLGLLGKNVQGMRELGKKLAIIEAVRQSNAASRKSQLGISPRFEEELYTPREAGVTGKFVS